MRWPFVTRAYHDAMLRVEQQRSEYLIDQVRDAQDTLLAERDRLDKFLEKFGRLMDQTMRIAQTDDYVAAAPEPELPEEVHKAILMRATRGSATYYQQVQWALEQARLGTGTDVIAKMILAGADYEESEDGVD